MNLIYLVFSKLLITAIKNFSNKEITPLKKVENNHWLLELFHGPTLAFKDIALQFLGNLFNFYLEENNNKLNIIELLLVIQDQLQ